MRKFTGILTVALCAVVFMSNAQDPKERVYNYPFAKAQGRDAKPKVEGWATQRVEEKINRGLVALKNADGAMYISWRLKKDDPAGVAFNLYRSIAGGNFSKINAKPLIGTTDFIDTKAPINKELTYMIRPVSNKKEGADSEKVTPIADGKNYTSIKLDGNHVFQKIALADLNGDGIYDFVIKQPNQTVDPGVWRKSETTWKIEAYLSDGTFLWRKDLGWNIEQGVWYSPYVVCDLNGDGKAEVAAKTAPTDRDYRDKDGRITGFYKTYYGMSASETCPEYCSIFDGMTGAEIARVDWPQQSPAFGDYNRNNRNQMAVAYLDGKTPALLLNRGTYRAMQVDAYHLNGTKMEKVWSWNGDHENPVVRSQGAHSITSADVDGDGREEVVMGGVVIDDDGMALWSAGIGHPDKATVAKINPALPGLQILYSCECWRDTDGVSMFDAKTGKKIWEIGQRTTHVGSGLAVDIDPAHPGLECFGSEDGKAGQSDRYMFTAAGERMGVKEDIPGDKAWIWWDADLLRETTAYQGSMGGRGTRAFNVAKYKGDTLTEGIEGSIVMIADMKGDWREEIITMLPGEIRVYSTTIPAVDRRVSLIQDPLYRSYITQRSMGYDQPAQVSYYLGVAPEDAAKYTPLIKK